MTTKKRRPLGRPPSAHTKTKRYKHLSHPHPRPIVPSDQLPPVLVNLSNHSDPNSSVFPSQSTPASSPNNLPPMNNNSNPINGPLSSPDPPSSSRRHQHQQPPSPPVPTQSQLQPQANSPASGPLTSPSHSSASSSPTSSVPQPSANTVPSKLMQPPTTQHPPVHPSHPQGGPPPPQQKPPSTSTNDNKTTTKAKTRTKSKTAKQRSSKHLKNNAADQVKVKDKQQSSCNPSPIPTVAQVNQPAERQIGQTSQENSAITPAPIPPVSEEDQDNNTQGTANDGSSKVIIFQCGTCRSIIADSTLHYEFDADCTTVSLEAASNVLVDDEVSLCKQGTPDAGCTYLRIVCAHCSAALGRVYVTTFPELDHRRNRFTLDTDVLITHRIGEGLTTKGEDIKLIKQQPKSDNNNNPIRDDINCNHPQDNNDTASTMMAVRDLEEHVDAVTNAVNTLTDAVRQSRFDMKDLRKNLDDVVTKVIDGENALGHVQGLFLAWDERIRDIDGCKDTLNRIIPVIHSLDNNHKRYAAVVEEERPEPSIPRITAAGKDSPTSSKSIPQVDTTTDAAAATSTGAGAAAAAAGRAAPEIRHHRRHHHDSN